MKFNAKEAHKRGMFFNYNEHLDDTIDALAKRFLGQAGIVGIADGIWDSGPVPGRPQGGPFSTVIFVYATQPSLAEILVPKQYNGYRVIVHKSEPLIPLGSYGRKV